MTDRAIKTSEPIPVDPARLAPGAWQPRTGRTIGQGDINASYSADRIGMGQPVRKPFSWNGGTWVCVGNVYRGGCQSAEAYRLVDPRLFDGPTFTYAEKVADGEAARADPNGFYHGMTVKHADAPLVLCGPPVSFTPGQSEQLSLF